MAHSMNLLSCGSRQISTLCEELIRVASDKISRISDTAIIPDGSYFFFKLERWRTSTASFSISSETNKLYSLTRFIISELYPRGLIRARTMITVSRTTLTMRLSDFHDGIPDIFFYFFICVFLSLFSCRKIKVIEPLQPVFFRPNSLSNHFFLRIGKLFDDVNKGIGINFNGNLWHDNLLYSVFTALSLANRKR